MFQHFQLTYRYDRVSAAGEEYQKTNVFSLRSADRTQHEWTSYTYNLFKAATFIFFSSCDDHILQWGSDSDDLIISNHAVGLESVFYSLSRIK